VIYTVHSKGEPLLSLENLDAARFVKDGFSWPAFVFTFLWLVYKRMWVVLAIAIAVQILLAAGADYSGAPLWLTSTTGLILSFFLGLEGNALYRWTLAGRGYDEEGLASGDSMDEAEIRYFAQ
jgi:Protein of unknown function (DUF2628)